jgi:hypothetical protein
LEEATMTQSTFPPPPPGVQPPYGQPYGPPAAGPYGAPAPGFGHQEPPRKKRTGLIVGSIVGALVLIGGAVIGALVLFGPKTLDQADVERGVTQLAEKSFGVAPQDVSCPADIEARSGGTFSCTGTLDGQKVSFTGTQTDDGGHYTVTSDNTVVPVSKVEERVSQEVQEQTDIEVTTSCDTGGRTVLVDPDDEQLSCTVTNTGDSTDTLDVTATVASDGTVSVQG